MTLEELPPGLFASVWYRYCSGAGPRDKNQSLQQRFGHSQILSSTRVTADYRHNCPAELFALCNRDYHLVRTLVAARCSALYLRTNLMSSVALGSHSVFSKLTSYSSPDGVYLSPTMRRACHS